MDYTLPEYLPIKESKKIAIETLDFVFNDLFGLHFYRAESRDLDSGKGETT